MAATSHCEFNKFGFCKYGDKCSLKHTDTICENIECDITICDLRHPRPCKYFEIYKRCKFTSYCKYSHGKCEPTNKDFKKKINILEKQVEILKSFMEDSLRKIDSLETEMKRKEKSINELKENVNKSEDSGVLENILKANVDDKIEHIEKNIKMQGEDIDLLKESMDFCDIMFVDKFKVKIYPNIYCEKCKRKLRLVDDQDLIQHMESVHRVFKCHKCDHVAESDRGRRLHIKKNNHY